MSRRRRKGMRGRRRVACLVTDKQKAKECETKAGECDDPETKEWRQSAIVGRQRGGAGEESLPAAPSRPAAPPLLAPGKF